MGKELLSDTFVKSGKPLQAGKLTTEKLFADGDGLYLRARPGTKKGTVVKHWLFIYTAPDGKRKKIALGGYPAHELADARKWARDKRAQLDNAIDPAEARRKAKQEKKMSAARTCESLLDAYVAHLTAKKKPSASDAENIFKLHVPADVKRLEAASVTHHDLIPLVRGLTEQGKVRTAAKLRSYLRAAFELALRAEDDPNAPTAMLGFKITTNPAARIKVPDGAGGTPGERALDRLELAEYRRRIETLPAGDTRDLLQLQLLLGGQRIAQLLTAAIETDTDGHAIVVIRDTKGKRKLPRRHELPLHGEALAIVEKRGMRLFGWTEPGDVKREQLNASSIIGKKICPAMLADKQAKSAFRMGDIRRTAETLLASIRVNQDVRAQLLSHGLSGVQNRHYDKHDYMKEKTSALKAWVNLLDTLEQKNVVPMNPRRRKVPA